MIDGTELLRIRCRRPRMEGLSLSQKSRKRMQGEATVF